MTSNSDAIQQLIDREAIRDLVREAERFLDDRGSPTGWRVAASRVDPTARRAFPRHRERSWSAKATSCT